MPSTVLSIYHVWLIGCCLLLAACGPDLPSEVVAAEAKLPAVVDFNQHIRPILTDRCYACHGPDDKARKAELRLDTEAGAFGALASGHGRAFIRGKPRKSVAFLRMISDDPERMMPPPESNLSLTPRELALVKRWIEQGAEWKNHWAFLPIEKPTVPALPNKAWTAHNDIDHYIQQRLAQEGLAPAPEADRERLLRRLTLDLTGLPPSPEETDAFLKDTAPDAYEKVVDRLLQSPAHAERLAMEWLDVARYADSHGLHADGSRTSWPWRDWVIEAFGENMPYDQFITWQLAGDLLPEATREQRLATSFLRMHPMTAEGGAIDEEFRLSYVFDRVNTVGTALLGMTTECARCHDHKFDPLRQEDFYSLSAFFNNVKELGMTGDDGEYGPILYLTDERTDSLLANYHSAISNINRQLDRTVEATQAQADFIKRLPAAVLPKDAAAYLPMEKLSGQDDKRQMDGRYRATNELSLDKGRKGRAAHFDHEYDQLYIKEIGNIQLYDPLSGAVWMNTVKRDSAKTQTLFGTSGNKNSFWRGWDFFLDPDNRLHLRILSALPHNYLEVQTQDSIRLRNWTHAAFTYDGSARAAGVRIYINGQLAPSEVKFDRLSRSTTALTDTRHEPTNRDIRVGQSYRVYTGEYGIFKGWLDELYVFRRELSPLEVAALADASTTTAWPEIQVKEHLAKQNQAYRALLKERYALQEKQLAIMDTVREVMVMEDMPAPRPTYVLDRGAYDAPREPVRARTPEVILPFPADLPTNRLGLARWLFLPDNPLPARVTVNRYWQLLFGEGLVSTTHDFGSQGTLPSHPALLDYLAYTFRESGWDVRALLRQMVLSATYRQSSIPTKDHREKDPENRLLARAPSYRLPAEMIRDNALAASGLLVSKIGGPSVKPYQPGDLWIEVASFSHDLLHYVEDEGDALHRRSMYTFIRRTMPPPFMINFDAPNRSYCVVKRENTNTPLQALNLMNDPQFVEAGRVLAARVQREGYQTPQAQIERAFRLVTGRKARPEEVRLLRELYESERRRFAAQPADADKLLHVGHHPAPADLDPVHTAALAMVSNTLLNFDEAYMKR